MLKRFKTVPFYIILIPAFFVIHAFVENYDFLSFKDLLLFTFIYVGVSLVVFFIFFIFFRRSDKSGLATALCMSVFLFFGVIHDFFKSNQSLGLFSRYSILLPLLLVLIVAFYHIISKKTSRLTQFSMYVNLVFLLFIVADLAGIPINSSKRMKNRISVSPPHSLVACDTCVKRDIYLLIFDEYESSLSLKRRFGFNNDLDSVLIQKGFSIQTHSRANYNFTPFCIASILNMSYLSGIKKTNSLGINEFSWCNRLIFNNHVVRLLNEYGYSFKNYSMFDFRDAPAIAEQSFLPTKIKLITSRTLAYRIKKDLGWILLAPESKDLYFEDKLDAIKSSFSLVKKHASEKHTSPEFVYAHFMMPHAPHLFDKNGNRRNGEIVYSEMARKTPRSYLDYLPYTNRKIEDLVNHIQTKNPSAVILLMGDHGYRDTDPSYKDSTHFFNNMNAVYIPGLRNVYLKDSISGVNQFRSIFNLLFNQQYPMLADTSMMLSLEGNGNPINDNP